MPTMLKISQTTFARVMKRFNNFTTSDDRKKALEEVVVLSDEYESICEAREIEAVMNNEYEIITSQSLDEWLRDTHD